MKKLQIFILYLLIISTICVDLRVVGTTVAYRPAELGLGLPRLTELLAALFICVSIFNVKLDKFSRLILSYIFLMSLFALFKPFYFNYWRSALIIPTMLLYCISHLKINKPQFFNILYVIFFSASISSLLVILSTKIDLGVAHFWANSDDGIERYIGFGQSLPYQACYSLMGIPLFVYLQKNNTIKTLAIINIICLFLNIMAIFLTGARTAYIILALLFLLYYRALLKNVKIWHIIVVLILLIYLLGAYWELIQNVLFARSEMELAGRDQVWIIAIKLIMSHPILGINNFFIEGREFGNVIAHSQNGFFEVWFWGGIVGFILCMAMYYNLYKGHRGDLFIKELSRGVFVVFLVYMITEILFFSVQAYYQFIIISSTVYAYARLKNKFVTSDEN